MDVLKQSLAHEDATWSESDYSWDQHTMVATKLGNGQHCSKGENAPILWREACVAKQSKGKQAKGKGAMICQVEGCGKDLNYEKGYYQRYRVCEHHLKMLSLVVDGTPSRFCQQCGRFQPLTEFDDTKRSCRQRLLQHNVRRRKRIPASDSRLSVKTGRKRQQRYLTMKLEPGSPDSLGMNINQQATSGSAAALESDKSSSMSMDARSNALTAPLDHNPPTASISQISQEESIPMTGSEQLSSLKPEMSSMDADPITSPYGHADDTSMGTSTLEHAGPTPWGNSALLLQQETCQLEKACSEWEMGSASRMGMPPNSSCMLPDTQDVCQGHMHSHNLPHDDSAMGRNAVPSSLQHAKAQPQLQLGSSGLHLGIRETITPCTPSSLLDGFIPDLDLPSGLCLPMEEHLGSAFQAPQRVSSSHSFGSSHSFASSKLDPFAPASHGDMQTSLPQSRGIPKRPMTAGTVFDNFGHTQTQRGSHGGMSHHGHSGFSTYSSPSLLEPAPFPMDMHHKMEQLSQLPMSSPKDPFSHQELDFLTRNNTFRQSVDLLPPALLEAQMLREESTLDQMYYLHARQKPAGRMMPGMQGDMMPGEKDLATGFMDGMPHLPMSPRLTSHMKGMDGGGFTLRGAPARPRSQLTSDLSLNLPGSSKHILSGHSESSAYACAGSNVPAPSHPSMSSFHMAKMMVAGGGAAATYSSDTSLHSLSVKLLNMRPEELPPNIRLRLQNMLVAGSASLHGAMRHGCIHLELDVLHHSSDSTPSGPMVPDVSTVQRSLGQDILKDRVVMVQMDGEVMILEDGQLKLQVAADSVVPDLPVVSSVEPLCVMSGKEVDVMLRGKGLLTEGTRLFARIQGTYKQLRLQVVQRGEHSADGLDVVQLTISNVEQGGLLTIMCQKESVLSSSVSVLAVQDAHVYAELAELLPSLPRLQAEMLVSDLGEVVIWQDILDEVHAAEHPLHVPTHDSASELMYYCNNPEYHIIQEAEGQAYEDEESEDEGGECVGKERLYEDEQIEPFDTDDDGLEEEGGYVDKEFNGGEAQFSASVISSDTAYEGGYQHPLLTEEFLMLVRRIACNCLQFACDRGASATAGMVLKALLAGGWIYSEVLMATSNEGLSLLHRGVRSGSLKMVKQMLKWNEQHKTTWAWGLEGQMGLTPLHLAAVLGPESCIAELVVASDIGACYMWMTAKSHDQLTPSGLAKQAGTTHIDNLAVQRLEFLIEGHSHLMSGLPAIRPTSCHTAPSAEAMQAEPQQQQQQQQEVEQLPQQAVMQPQAVKQAEVQPAHTTIPTEVDLSHATCPGAAAALAVGKSSTRAFPASTSPPALLSPGLSPAPRTPTFRANPNHTLCTSAAPVTSTTPTLANTASTCEVEALHDTGCSSAASASTNRSCLPSSSTLSATLPSASTSSPSQLPSTTAITKPPSRKCARMYRTRRQQEMQLTITTEAIAAAYALCFVSFLLALVSEMPLLQYSIVAVCALWAVVRFSSLSSILSQHMQRLSPTLSVFKHWRLTAPIPVPHHPFTLLFCDTALEESFVQHLSMRRSYKESMISVVFAGVVACLPVVLNKVLKLDLTSPNGGVIHASLVVICHLPHIWLCLLLLFPLLAMVTQKAWYQSNHDAILLIIQLLSVMLVRTAGSGAHVHSPLAGGMKVVVSSMLSLLLAMTMRVRFRLQLWSSLWEMISGLLVCAGLPQSTSARCLGVKMGLSALTIVITYAWERVERSKFTQNRGAARQKVKEA